MQAVFYSDGSSKPNPGYSGYGIHGYLYNITDKNLRPKHPIKNKLYFTTDGYSELKPDNCLDIKLMVDASVSIPGNSQTNNNAELLAVKWVLDNYLPNPDVDTITIFTDSSYVVNCYNDCLLKWHRTNWTKTDGQLLFNALVWRDIYFISEKYKALGKTINLRWLKGHNGDYGNETADLYAAIGTIASKHQQDNSTTFTEELFHKTFTLKDYKASFEFDDILYNFKHLYFSNDKQDDKLYCFLFNPPEKSEQTGKKSLESMFAINLGFIPEIVNNLKDYHRSLSRQVTGASTININILNSNNKLRLFNWVPAHYLLTTNDITNSVYLVNDTMPIMADIANKMPLIMNINKIYDTISSIEDSEIGHVTPGSYLVDVDVTDKLFKDGKLLISNKVKHIDITDDITSTELKSKLLTKIVLSIGNDVLSYLAMKRIEDEVERVNVKLSANHETNGVTCLVVYTLKTRKLMVTNITNKFLFRS